MTDPSEEAAYIEKLYEYGEQLNSAKDKSQVTYYLPISKTLNRSSSPRFFFSFLSFSRVLDCSARVFN